MSCRKAFDIDLVVFLGEPRAAAFAGFRDHYPRCRECSAEVRAWTELHRTLGARGAGAGDAHPAPEILARFQAQPDALASAERSHLEDHLADCASCRDELRGLASFREGTAAAPSGEAGGSWLRALLDRLRIVVWHPAFAYALAGILLVPLVQQAVGPLGEADAPLALSELEENAGLAHSSDAAKPADAKLAGELDRARAERDDAPRAPAPAPRVAAKRQLAAAPQREAAAEPEMLRREAARGVVVQVADAVEELAQEPLPALAPTSAAGFREGPPLQVEVAAAGRGMRLRVPLPASPAVGPVEVRILDADGRRELRERVSTAAASGAGYAPSWVEVEVPAGWLAPGAYRVELHFEDDTGRPRLERFDLAVGRAGP